MREGSGLRWREDTGVEARCPACRDYWPLTREFWMPERGFARCRACYLESRRGLRHGMPAFRSAAAAARRRATDNARKAAERRDPEKRPVILEQQALRQRRYYDTHRDVILARRRAKDVDRRPAFVDRLALAAGETAA